MSKYNVTWLERHTVVVEAESESEAIDLANAGETVSDETMSMESGFDASIIKE